MNYNFEWDFNKAKINLKNHNVSFESASSLFKDINVISIFDEKHSQDEERWITIGLNEETRTLVVIHTFISIEKDEYNIRIISARKATKKEQKTYQAR